MTFHLQALRNRPRMLIGLIVGVLVAAIIPIPLRSSTVRVLIGWDGAVWTYLLLIWIEMAYAHHEQIQAVATREPQSSRIGLFVVCLATVVSLVAIVVELASAKSLGLTNRFVHYALTGFTLFGGWFLIPTIFTLHYARLYYAPNAMETPLLFPDRELEPNYWDFLYFSFTIAVASQTSDVVLRSRLIRRAALVQSILSFFFNVAVLGLCLNIAAGLLGS
jgi:uncharacterized membrane protein